MKALWKLDCPSGTLSSLTQFYDSIESYTRGLNALGKKEDSYGDLLVPIIQEKLPATMRRQLARDDDTEGEWTLDKLRKAIRHEIDSIQAADAIDSLVLDDNPPATAAFFTTTKKTMPYFHRPYPCVFCKQQGHKSGHCTTVTSKKERNAIVKRDKLCTNCFSKRHTNYDCQSVFRCRDCSGKHHTSLCLSQTQKDKSNRHKDNNKRHDEQPRTSNPEDKRGKQQQETHQLFTSNGDGRHPVLLKTAVTQLYAGNSSLRGTVLFDEGSQRTFITESIARKLDLNPIGNENMCVSTFGASSPAGVQSLPIVYVVLHDRENSGEITVRALVVPQITTPMQNLVNPDVANLPHLRNLALAHPPTYMDTFEIALLIGADQFWNILGNHIVRGKGPIAVSSKLGYLLSGPNPTVTASVFSTNVMNVSVATQLEKFWDIESIGITDKTTTKDITYEDYTETHLRKEDNRYIAKLPWREDHPPLPTNYNVCRARTRNMVRRLTPYLRKVYHRIIHDQVNRGFVDIVEEDDFHQGHYLPHHPVKKDSETTPIRVVYDCSCKTANGNSLNDCLDAGPPLLNDLAAILLRFRTQKFGLSADLEKAFLHIGLDESDQQWTKFLWLSDPDDPESPFTVFQFKAILFGAVCSPFILNATVKHHLEMNASPVSQDISKNTYVDNIISGAETVEDLVNYYHEANMLTKDARFNLREWATNSVELRNIAQNENRANSDPETNVLGITWNTNTDELAYPDKHARSTDNDKTLTKRECLKITAGIYDPLGFFAPTHIRAKMFIQKLWRENLQWDEPMSEELHNEWINLNQDLLAATAITVPRPYFSSMQTDAPYQLHVFCDASAGAYGCVVYLRQVNTNTVSIVMSKARVTPVKTLTIPRAELMAALLGARLLNFVTDSLKEQLAITGSMLWSDSQIVLHWLSSDKKLPCFVQNRITEIKACDVITEFRYCPTDANPADLVSRGVSAENLSENNLWWTGPDWLKTGDWPTREIGQPDVQTVLAAIANEEAINTVNVNNVACQPAVPCGIMNILDSERYSSLRRLLRLSALVLRFINNLKSKKENRLHAELNASEINEAEQRWIKDTQVFYYREEMKNLKMKAETLGTLARQLWLFIDNDGILRVGGRLHNAPMRYSMKFPILIPPKSRLAALIVLDCHAKKNHSGLQSTITYIRYRYWITQIRVTVKTLLRTCVICKFIYGKPYRKPIPAPLQSFRLLEAHSFTVTGVDFTGALFVKDGTRETKAYICLFTCAVTRAIHLELVLDMSSETFIRAFRRFVARRSLPSKMVSDNGSTYLAAANELTELFKSRSVKRYLADRRVQWINIPKRAPWWGGFWERLIGLTKTSLKKVLGRAFVSVDELNTLLIEVEAGLNDRPLTYISEDVDVSPLSPSHFLMGHSITALPYDVDTDELDDPTFGQPQDLRNHNIRLGKLQADFWKRWTSEYLSSLRENDRISGKGITHNIVSVGDVVQIENSSVPRTRRNLGVITKVYPGRDRLIRSVDLKTKSGQLNRPIAKLYPLEVNSTMFNAPDDNETPTKPPAGPIAQDTNNDARDNARPKRKSALKAQNKIKDWAKDLLN
ncbi:uncharacterized protein LOC135483687 [Lineus longissimus]|uniref:uncharacterized protein LOC135483687 n=1 Tax=Lineus longissimus TaxID=88925 RepID=UPI00315D1793